MNATISSTSGICSGRAGERAIEFVSDLSKAHYLRDHKTQAAVERVIEIIGEAARRVTVAGRAQLPGIEWGPIVASRHILAHEYGEIDHDKIWSMVTIHIPDMLEQLRPVLRENPPGPKSAESLDEP